MILLKDVNLNNRLNSLLGSVFQRPPGHFAGKLIQDSNLQGYRIGGVEVSTKHAGFMVNVTTVQQLIMKHLYITYKK